MIGDSEGDEEELPGDWGFAPPGAKAGRSRRWDRTLIVSFMLAAMLHGSVLAVVIWRGVLLKKPGVQMAGGSGGGQSKSELFADAGGVKGDGDVPLPRPQSSVEPAPPSNLSAFMPESALSPLAVATVPRELILSDVEQTMGWIGLAPSGMPTTLPTRRGPTAERAALPGTSVDATAVGTDGRHETPGVKNSDGEATGQGGKGGGLPMASSGNQPPVYPMEAVRRRWQGTTVLHVAVRANGLVSDLKVIESSGHELLDQAAMTAVKQWRFSPGTKEGRAVDCEVDQEVRFVLRGE